jgi:hypothetical protein
MWYVLEAVNGDDGTADARCWVVANEGEFVRVVDLYHLSSGGLLGALDLDPNSPPAASFEQATRVNGRGLSRHEIFRNDDEALKSVSYDTDRGRLAEAWAVLDAVGDVPEIETRLDDLRDALRRKGKDTRAGYPSELETMLQCLPAAMWGKEPAMTRPDFAAGAESVARIAYALAVKMRR